MITKPTPAGAATAVALCAVTAWWTAAVIVEGPRDPAPPPPSRETCAVLEDAARRAAPTLPGRQQAAEQALRERGEIVAVYVPMPCAPGWEGR